MEKFNIGDEVFFRNKSSLMSGRIFSCECQKESEISIYLIKTIDSTLKVITYKIKPDDVITKVHRLDSLNLLKLREKMEELYVGDQVIFWSGLSLLSGCISGYHRDINGEKYGYTIKTLGSDFLNYDDCNSEFDADQGFNIIYHSIISPNDVITRVCNLSEELKSIKIPSEKFDDLDSGDVILFRGADNMPHIGSIFEVIDDDQGGNVGYIVTSSHFNDTKNIDINTGFFKLPYDSGLGLGPVFPCNVIRKINILKVGDTVRYKYKYTIGLGKIIEVINIIEQPNGTYDNYYYNVVGNVKSNATKLLFSIRAEQDILKKVG